MPNPPAGTPASSAAPPGPVRCGRPARFVGEAGVDAAPATRTPDPRRSLGQAGEDLVARYLTDRGMQVLERNWRCREGELDLVALAGDCVVAVEVKTRRSTAYGDPIEAITWAKAARLRRLASAWIAEHDVRPARVRIDVVGVLWRPGQPPLLRHVEAVGA